MGNNHKNFWKIFGVILINTLLILSVIGYNKRNISIYNSTTQAKEGETIVTEIWNVEDYIKFAESITEENDYEYYEVVLYSDLDFSGITDFPVIGASENMDDDFAFDGIFDGNGHVLSGIHIDKPDEAVGLFAKLNGIVKNLRIENSSFRGELCGAIAAENYEGAILNCYVNASVIGDIGGDVAGLNYDGEISNCVSLSAIAGENLYGNISHCYLIEAVDVEDLNRNLYNISGAYRDPYFCCWEYSEEGILSRKKADLLESLTARITVDGHEIKLNGYYAENTAKWCFALPAGYGEANLYLEARTSKGGFESFKRCNEEED